MTNLTDKALKLGAKLVVELDLNIVPWKTTLDEWTLCFNQSVNDHVWMENALIQQFAKGHAKEITDPVLAFHDTFRELGRVVFKWLGLQSASQMKKMIDNQQVMSLQLADCKINMRIGFFNGVKFLFVPKLQYERSSN